MKVLDFFMASLRLMAAMTLLVLYFAVFRILRPWKKDKTRYGMRMQQAYANVVLKVFGTRLTITGALPPTPALLVANHRSLLDPVIIISQITARGVSKAEVEGYPILGAAVRQTGIIFVKRDDRQSRLGAKNAIGQHLEQGWSVLVFPEGTVSNEKTTLPFKKGSFEQAVEAGVPVVPIALIYNHSRYYWYRVGLLAYYFRSFGWQTPNVHMMIGSPIAAEETTQVMEQSQHFINDMLRTHAPTN